MLFSRSFSFIIGLFNMHLQLGTYLETSKIYLFIIIFFYKVEILLYHNLSVYVCETPSWRFEFRPLPPTLHKHLYLWSDHHTNGVRWRNFKDLSSNNYVPS